MLAAGLRGAGALRRILSSESLLLARNSGCLNSHAWVSRSVEFFVSRWRTYVLSVWRLATILVILSDFVKIVLVELAHKTGKVAMLEMFGQDGLGEFFTLNTAKSVECDRRFSFFFLPYLQDDEAVPFVSPAHDRGVRGVLQHSGIISIWWTRCEFEGFMASVEKEGGGQEKGESEHSLVEFANLFPDMISIEFPVALRMGLTKSLELPAGAGFAEVWPASMLG